MPGQNIRLAVCAVCAKQTMLFPLGRGHSQYAHRSYFANIANTKNIANNTKYILKIFFPLGRGHSQYAHKSYLAENLKYKCKL